MSDLEFVLDSGVGIITLNRPETRNAITRSMVDRWVEVLEAARTDDDIRVLIVTGAGPAFCSGADVKAMTPTGSTESAANATPTPWEAKRGLSSIHRIPYAMEALDKPVIAAVNGAAVGAGMDVALMCDIRFASKSARFSEGYIRVGLVPGDGGCFYLPRIVGLPKALELLLSGDFVDADEALRIGLVNRVADDGELMTMTVEFARQLAALPPVQLQLIKRCTYQSYGKDLRTALELVSSYQGIVRSLDDSREAVKAFMEKRVGTFFGR